MKQISKQETDAEAERTAIYRALLFARESNLETEVVWSALHNMKNNCSISEAVKKALDEWTS